MTTTFTATFDGKVFVPDQPANLTVGQRVRVLVAESPSNGEAHKKLTLGEFLEQFPSDPDSPTDAAAQHDHYLYGTPKRENP
jgi:hypothetical protein